MGPFGLTGTANWRSSMKNVLFEGGGCEFAFADGSDAPNGCRLASFWTFDLTGRWNVTKELQIFATIQNLFDCVAPLDPLTYGGSRTTRSMGAVPWDATTPSA